MKYLAYGSNMVLSQMATRCPEAVFVGVGYIDCARLEFYLHATVEKTHCHADHVPVAVWEISDRDEQARRFEAARGNRRALGESEYPLDAGFLDALPAIGAASGAALGVDRLVMVLTGAKEISAVRAKI